MNVFDKIKIFVRKYPKLNKKYSEFGDKFLLKSVNSLNVVAKHLIEVKGKNPDAPLPISSGDLFLESLKDHLKFDKKFLRVPYTPAWLASSFKNPEKHPLFHRAYLKEDTLLPVKVVEEQPLQVTEALMAPVASEAKQIDLKDLDVKTINTINYILADFNESVNIEPPTPLEELELYLDKEDEDDLSYKKIDPKKVKKAIEKARKLYNLEAPKAPKETLSNKTMTDLKFKKGPFRKLKKD